VVIVSHDRAMLRASCDKFVLVADGKAEAFDGDLDDYKEWLAEQRSQEKKTGEKNAGKRAEPVSTDAATKPGNDRAQSKADRQARILERRPLVKESEQLEARMAQWQDEKSQIDARMTDASLYEAAGKIELQALIKRQAELTNNIEDAEERWMLVLEQLEALPALP